MWGHYEVICLLFMPFVLALTSTANTGGPQSVSSGIWGGDHIRIEVERGTTTIEYDCASGTIRGPLTINSAGRFDLRGTHSRERGGPVRSDETPHSEAARYTGWTDGMTMTLTVTLASTKEEIGTFKLFHGKEGRVWKCK